MGVTFLHTGDLHLGSPLRAISGASAEFGTRLARATQDSFRRIVSAALERDVDFVVVAGDLYDRKARSVRANEFLVAQFERLDDADIPCYVVHGNHDPLGEGAEKLSFPSNVHVFGTDEVEQVEYAGGEGDNPAARILGQSYGARHESNRLYYEYTPPADSVPTIGILHTGLNPDGRRYAPCSQRDLASKPIDYWALGHIHQPELLREAPGAYCGIPQGRHVGEAGLGGCLLVELEIGAAPDIAFLPTSPVVWQTETVDVERAATDGQNEIRNLTDLEGYLETKAFDIRAREPESFQTIDIPIADTDWDPDGFVCRWELTGRGEIARVLADDSAAVETLVDRLRSRLDGADPFIWTDTIRDRTGAPLPDRETLAAEDDVIAELISLTADRRTDPAVRNELRDRVGAVWEPVDDIDREDTPPDRLPLTTDRLDDLIDRALATAIESLATRRNHVD